MLKVQLLPLLLNLKLKVPVIKLLSFYITLVQATFHFNIHKKDKKKHLLIEMAEVDSYCGQTALM